MSCHNSTDTSLETRVIGFWTACNLWKRECTVSSPYINPQRVETQIDQSVKSRTKTIVWKIKAHLGGHSSSPERVVWFTTFELLIRAPDDSCTYEKSFTGLRTVSDLSAQVYIVLLIHAEQAELYIKSGLSFAIVWHVKVIMTRHIYIPLFTTKADSKDK